MSVQFHRQVYDNISQRAVATLANGVIPLAPVTVGTFGVAGEQMELAQRDLHGFLTTLYEAMYQQPEQFGMPTSPDDCLASEREGKERKQEVTKKIKRPEEIIDIAIALLRDLGLQGQVSGNDLVLDETTYKSIFESKGKTKKTILAAMTKVGLGIQMVDGAVALHNTHYPQMMPALKAMAEGCAADGDAKWGASAFARCDLKAILPGYQLDPASLLGYFPPEDRVRAIDLHHYMLDTGHEAVCRAYNAHGWDIQYHGSRKIKGTTLVQIDYSERHRNPMRVHVKCASVNRLISSFSEQPAAVQADFRSRVGRCSGDSCGWCKEKKGLRPSVLEYDGEKLTVCWFAQAHFEELDDKTFELIQGYVRWHQGLNQG